LEPLFFHYVIFRARVLISRRSKSGRVYC